MNKQETDPFGFKGQAQDYDIERPRYSQNFIDEILRQTSSFNNYIDVASGTGILFYELAHKFNGKLIVQDRSKKQLDVAREKLSKTELNASNVDFVESDAFDIHNHLPQGTKFDLITIAQAFHWLENDKFCQYVVNELLSENGTFAVCGYFCEGFDYNTPEDLEFAKSAQRHYDKFYSTVLPHFDCDRTSLDQGHTNFDFTKHFEKTEFIREMTQVELPLERVCKYLGTYSAYNIYKSKFGSKEDFEDPLVVFRKGIEEDLNGYYAKNNVSPKEKPLVMRMPFFLWILKNGKKLG